MAIWIEIRCENQANPSSGLERAAYSRCESHDNSGPQGLVADAREGMLAGIRRIERGARDRGWKRTKYGWICPYCAAQPAAMTELAAERG